MQIELNTLINQLIKQQLDKDINFNQALDKFLVYIKNFKAQETFRYNQSHVNMIRGYAKQLGIINLSQITNDSLIGFIELMKIQNLNNDTINKRIGIIKRIYKMNIDDGLISSYSFKDLKLKTILKPIETISVENLELILNYSKTLCLQSQLILLLLISTGIRRKELSVLKIKNINWEENSIFLEQTKTNNQRFIFFDEETKVLIHQQIKENKVYIFENKTGKPIDPEAISSIVDRIKKRLNLKGLSPHKFRHTYATFLVKNGVDIEFVRRLLGHTTYTMTKRYVHLVNKDLINISKKYNPLNLLKN